MRGSPGAKSGGLPVTAKDKLLSFFSQPCLCFETGYRNVELKYAASHSHPAYEIVHHLKGGGVTSSRAGDALRYEQGSTVIYPPDTPHKQVGDVPGEDLCVLFSLPGPSPECLSRRIYVPPFDDRYIQTEMLSFAEVPPEIADVERVSYHYRITALVLHLLRLSNVLGELADLSAADIYAQRARMYIRDHFLDITSLRDVADHIGISLDYLRHVFRDRYGVSLLRWLNEVRIERARELLAHSRLSQKRIAKLCGFGTESYFGARFREAVGSSPGVFRRQHRHSQD